MLKKYFNYAEVFGFTVQKIITKNLYKGPLPKIYCSSIPKAGTHLLERILTLRSPLSRFLHLTLDEIRYAHISNADLAKILDKVKAGKFILSHLYHNPKREKIVLNHGFKMIQLVRDPRDIVVSDAYYVKRHKKHPNYDVFLDIPLEEVINICILGNSAYDVNFINVGDKTESYKGWMNAGAYTLKYEDYITGNFNEQINFINEIYNFIGLEVSKNAIREIARNSISQNSVTFRSGKTGEWKKTFTDKHKKMFKEVAGQQLIELGYEKDYDW